MKLGGEDVIFSGNGGGGCFAVLRGGGGIVVGRTEIRMDKIEPFAVWDAVE